MYLSISELASMFHISRTTVYRKIEGIEAEIGKRYNRYAIIDNRISAAVFADFYKYGKLLQDRRYRKNVPAFNEGEASEYLMKGVGA